MTELVEPERTPATTLEALQALSDAWLAVTGERPPGMTLFVLLAQSCLETGWWRKLNNHNVGGVKCTAGVPVCAEYLTHEVFDGVDKVLVQRFRAYASLAEGFEDFVGLLRRRYGSALEHARMGDAGAYARELKRLKYYTGSVDDYARNVASLTREFASLPLDLRDLVSA